MRLSSRLACVTFAHLSCHRHVSKERSSTVRLIGAGSRHSVAVLGNGELYMWGRPEFGCMHAARREPLERPCTVHRMSRHGLDSNLLEVPLPHQCSARRGPHVSPSIVCASSPHQLYSSFLTDVPVRTRAACVAVVLAAPRTTRTQSQLWSKRCGGARLQRSILTAQKPWERARSQSYSTRR